MNVLITGANGFIGYNLISTMSLIKDLKLTVISRKNINKFKHFNIEIINDDILNINKNYHKNQVKNIDIVIHIAGLTKSINSNNFYISNTLTTVELLKFAKKVNAKQFIFISSLAACGPSINKTPDETSTPRPVSNYGLSKLIAEKMVIKSKIPYTIIRPPAVFGPGDKDILSYFKMVKGGISLISGELTNSYSLLFVDDLVNFIIKILNNQLALNQTFFLSYEQPHTILDILSAIEQAEDKKSLKITIPKFLIKSISPIINLFYRVSGYPPLLNSDKLSEILQPSWKCSAAKAASILQFKPKKTFHEAVKETYKWYKEQRWL